jgi:hypothetical protein
MWIVEGLLWVDLAKKAITTWSFFCYTPIILTALNQQSAKGHLVQVSA